jgi:hypothetical protein
MVWKGRLLLLMQGNGGFVVVDQLGLLADCCLR